MNILSRSLKLLVIGLTIFLGAIFWGIDSVYAVNATGGFAAGTMISTANGDVPVEELQSGDRVIGYNFTTHQTEENVVEAIEHKTSLSYYSIDEGTKIAGTNLIYAKTSDNLKLIRLQQLKPKNKLLAHDHSYITINFVEQIVKPIVLYRVIINNRTGNLYAGNLLTHVGDEIPGYFKDRGINCKPGTPYFKQCPNINSTSGLVAAVITITFIPLVGALAAKSILYIRNFIRFGDLEFSDNIDLIDFTTSINPNFTNRYSLKYYDGVKVWCSIPLKPEIAEEDYQQIVEKSTIVKRVNHLYTQYHRDLINQDFSHIVWYFPGFRYQTRHKNYREYFSDRFDLIYQPKILKLAILGLEIKTNEATIFKIQINAEMINFVISQAGYILTGEPKVQQYSEYWYIELSSDGQWCIHDIKDTLTTRIMSGDKRARREAYADFTAA